MNLKCLSKLGHQILDLSVSTHRNMSVYGDLFSSNLVIGGNGVVNYVIFVTQNVCNIVLRAEELVFMIFQFVCYRGRVMLITNDG